MADYTKNVTIRYGGERSVSTVFENVPSASTAAKAASSLLQRETDVSMATERATEKPEKEKIERGGNFDGK